MTATVQPARAWWERPGPRPYASPRDARLAGLAALSESPDLCRWQYEATDRGEHVSVYCVLTDAVRHLELALTDERFDDDDPAAVDSSSDLLYLYDSVLFRTEQLLRDLYQLATERRSGTTGKVLRYVNTLVKHRADSGGRHSCDHHLELRWADFDLDPVSPGVRPSGEWSVPSLPGFVGWTMDQLVAFDSSLEDVRFRERVEAARTAAWEPDIDPVAE
jgi:hypothetical protein